jgi:hypothetical protein
MSNEREARISDLRAAIEGECDGLHTTYQQAAAIIDYVDSEQAARQSAGATGQEPVATLHDDGHWTWKKGIPPHESNYAGWRMDVYAAPIGDNGVQQKDEHARERIARALHYPACWDTAAYPTLDSAALEAIACAKLGCSECEKPSDASAGYVYRCNQCGSFDIERYPYAASQPAESKRVELTEEQWRIIQAPTGSLLFDAGVHSACTRIRELLARASAKEE